MELEPLVECPEGIVVSAYFFFSHQYLHDFYFTVSCDFWICLLTAVNAAISYCFMSAIKKLLMKVSMQFLGCIYFEVGKSCCGGDVMMVICRRWGSIFLSRSTLSFWRTVVLLMLFTACEVNFHRSSTTLIAFMSWACKFFSSERFKLRILWFYIICFIIKTLFELLAYFN